MGSMYVWIPRYAYAITSNYHNGGNGISGTIKIAFLDGTKEYNKGANIDYTYQGNSDKAILVNKTGEGNWNEHPAFNFGGTILSGIWVAKYEASHSDAGNASTLEGSSQTIKIQPNVTSWRNAKIGDMFTYCQNMNSSEEASNYGISTNKNEIDPHMMKNSEWGVVTYLAQSSYGRNGNEISINNSNGFITGNSGGSADASFIGTKYAYDSQSGQKASTTGNISGIYDMSGGAYEYVASYMNNNSYVENYASSILYSNERYKDVYDKSASDTSNNNYDINNYFYGDALYETSNSATGNQSWFNDYSAFLYSNYPFFYRGGSYSNSSFAGIFSFDCIHGDISMSISFRPVLAIM